MSKRRINERKVHYIDVSKMSEKELCQTLNIEYAPWYRDSIFLALALVFAMPSIFIIILEVLK